MDQVVDTLRAQLDELEGLLAPLDESGWARPSACPGWTIADVVLHLAQTNEMALASLRGSWVASAAGWADPSAATVDALADLAVARERDGSGAEVHRRWQASADAMVTAFRACAPDQRVEWVAGELAARTLASTRVAETWIHTQDVAEGLGVELPGTARLWPIARLAQRTLPYASPAPRRSRRARCASSSPRRSRVTRTGPSAPTTPRR